MQGSRSIAILAVVASIMLYSIHYMSIQPPTTRPVTVPLNEFFAERAYIILEKLLKENVAHPIGSEENEVVKLRIMNELKKLDIEFTEQRTWACSGIRFNLCAFVENIVAIIPPGVRK